MKKIIIFMIAFLPLASFASKGPKDKDKEITIRISTDKKGKIKISGLDKNKDLKELEKDINEALKDVTINFEDGKEKHKVHFKAELKIE